MDKLYFRDHVSLQVSRDGALVTGLTLQAAVTGLTVRLDVHLPLR